MANNPDDTGDIEGPFCKCNFHCTPHANEGKVCWISGQAIPPGYYSAEEDASDQERATGEGMPSR